MQQQFYAKYHIKIIKFLFNILLYEINIENFIIIHTRYSVVHCTNISTVINLIYNLAHFFDKPLPSIQLAAQCCGIARKTITPTHSQHETAFIAGIKALITLEHRVVTWTSLLYNGPRNKVNIEILSVYISKNWKRTNT